MSNDRQSALHDMREAAKSAIPFIEIASITITAAGFFILLSGLDFFLRGRATGDAIYWVSAILIAFVAGVLAFGFIKTEKGINISFAIRRAVSPILIMALVGIGATNLIVGIYRSASANVERQEVNREAIHNSDAIIQSKLAEKDNLQTHVVNDGAVQNDAFAMERMAQIDAEVEAREASLLSQLKPVADGTYNMFVIGILAFVSVIFAAAIHLAYKDDETNNNPQPVTKTKQRKKEKKPPPGSTDQPDKEHKTSLAKANKTIQRNKQERMQLLEEFIEEKPEATLSEMADFIGVSSRETVRKYLNELGHRALYHKY